MNSPLASALSELKLHGATGLPSPTKVEKAAYNSSWTGKKSGGETWTLTKNSKDSYNCQC